MTSQIVEEQTDFVEEQIKITIDAFRAYESLDKKLYISNYYKTPQELLRSFASTLIEKVQIEERKNIAKWFEKGLDGEYNGKQIAEIIKTLAPSYKR